jgi:chorismate lyase/3-hydroxybenzoate synthase
MSAPPPISAAVIVAPLAPTPPHWVEGYLTGPDGSQLSLVTANIPHATALNGTGLSDAVADVYRSILRDLRAHARHPVRMWNFVPDIHSELESGDRYMAFNTGRFAAFTESFGLADGVPATIPTASAVGITGTTLWIHVLAANTPGVPIENPRQIPAYRYSKRYGQRPPCFARATRFGSSLFIGGTASITGEDSRHVCDIHAQTQETLSNLRALIAAATGASDADTLSTLRDLRIHVTQSQNEKIVRDALEQVVPATANLEFVEAELCRRELLVEIEGVARCA